MEKCGCVFVPGKTLDLRKAGVRDIRGRWIDRRAGALFTELRDTYDSMLVRIRMGCERRAQQALVLAMGTAARQQTGLRICRCAVSHLREGQQKDQQQKPRRASDPPAILGLSVQSSHRPQSLHVQLELYHRRYTQGFRCQRRFFPRKTALVNLESGAITVILLYSLFPA